MTDMTDTPAHAKRARWQAPLVLALIAVVGVSLAAYAAAASYESVSGLAAAHHVPLPRLNPAGIDGGLFGVIVISVALVWLGIRLPWLRATARLFAAGTIVANAAAGWPDPVGVGLRIAAPVLFVVLMETAMAVLLHRDDGADEGVPPSRWLLDFTGTFRLWRRMKLWRIRDYRLAVDMELSRLQAIEALSARFGKSWQDKIPGDLAWMLRRGVRMDTALARVAELTGPERKTSDRTERPRKPQRRTGQSRRTTARTTQADKRELVLSALKDNPLRTDVDIAAEAGVSAKTVSRYRNSPLYSVG